MISENGFLVPPKSRKSFCEADTYLIIADDQSLDMKNDEEDASQKIEKLKDKIDLLVRTHS
jgi:hypothetical protein